MTKQQENPATVLIFNDDQKAGILGDTAARVLQIRMDETSHKH